MSNHSVKLTLSDVEFAEVKKLAGYEPVASFLKRQAFQRITLPVEGAPTKLRSKIVDALEAAPADPAMAASLKAAEPAFVEVDPKTYKQITEDIEKNPPKPFTQQYQPTPRERRIQNTTGVGSDDLVADQSPKSPKKHGKHFTDTW